MKNKGRNRMSLFYRLLFLLGVYGCQGDVTPSTQSNPSDIPLREDSSQNQEKVEHQLFAKAGPDDAFFMQAYLGQVAEIINNSGLDLEAVNNFGTVSEGSADEETFDGNAFDFRQNFSDRRLELMVDYLFFLNDGNRDGLLSLSEASAMRTDPTVLGNPGSAQSMLLQVSVFEKFAGQDEQLVRDEMISLLLTAGHQLTKDWDSLAHQQYCKEQMEAWDQVIVRFDQDSDGTLSRAEYDRLREERQKMLNLVRSNISSVEPQNGDGI